jgi:type I restriction enzyme S subunit
VIGQKLKFWKGDIIYGKRRAYQRKLAVADFDGICSAHAMVLRAKPDVILPELLPFFLQSEIFHQRAMEISVGSLSPTINWTTLAKQEFPLPPVDEQRRIADLLWAADDAICSYSDLLNATNNLAKSRLSSFIKSFNQKKNIHKVKDLLTDEPKNGYSPNANESGKGYRTVSISAISNGKFDPEGCIKFADIEYQQISSYFVQKDDVFVVRGNGNRYLAGKCGIAAESFEDMFYPDLLIRLRFDDSIIFPAFATMQWNDPFVHRDFISRAKSTNGIWKVNGQDVRKHTLVVPPLDEQKKFLTEDNMYKNAMKNLEDCYEQVSKIKSQLLNNYLTG